MRRMVVGVEGEVMRRVVVEVEGEVMRRMASDWMAGGRTSSPDAEDS